jgi:serine/threonine protein phosphatase 1
MKRTLVIGDIHGGLRGLQQVLGRASATQNDRLVFLGDYVDAWSESPQTLDFLIDFKQVQDCIFIRGNHDELLLHWLRGNDNELWHQHGGLSTMASYEGIGNHTRKKHIGFLESLRNYWLDKQNRLFIHAGFTNQHGVAHEYYPRLFYWDRTLWETAASMDQRLTPADRNYPRRLMHYPEIFIGHTPVTKIGEDVPTRRATVWNIDTGAGFAGRLSIIDADSKGYWQSDPLPDLYPGEKGRN